MNTRPEILSWFSGRTDGNEFTGFVLALDDGRYRVIKDGEILGTFRKLKVANRRVAALLSA